MKYQKMFVSALVLLLGVGATSAWAHDSRARVGVYIGGPVWGPVWYPPPYYYPPRVVVVQPAPPPVYIEQAESPAPAAQQYWYYCASVKGYYPYVKECPEGWQKVLPQPEQR